MNDNVQTSKRIHNIETKSRHISLIFALEIECASGVGMECTRKERALWSFLLSLAFSWAAIKYVCNRLLTYTSAYDSIPERNQV